MVFGAAALTRAQYLSLLERGVTTPHQFEAADNTTLTDATTVRRSNVAVALYPFRVFMMKLPDGSCCR